MSNALKYIKGSRTRILNTLPSKDFGNEGDFVISHIKGKGVFLCTKVGNSWFTANKLQQLDKIGIANLNEITTNKLTFNRVVNSSIDTDKFIVSDGGQLKYRTGEQVADELGIAINDIQYKQAYCSLGQYTNKEDCEANNGTWYYSENDSHDSISSTAENELLTVASSLGKLDAEPTLLYDGSTLEIKRNSDFDDNWQTSAQDSLLKLSYDSSNNAIFGVNSSGDLTLDVVGDIYLDAFGKQINFAFNGTTIAQLDLNSPTFKLMHTTDQGDYFNIGVAANGHTTFTTVDDDGTAANLSFVVDGDVDFEVAGDQVYFQNDSGNSKVNFDWSTDNSPFIQLTSGGSGLEFVYFKIAIDGNGDTTLTTKDGNAGTASSQIYLNPESYVGIDGSNLMLDATQKLYFDANNPGGAIGNTYIQESGADVLDFYVGDVNILKLEEAGGGASDKVSIPALTPLYFDGGTHTHIAESAADVLDITVGNLKMMTLDEGNTKVEVLGADLEIDSGKRLYLDGGGDTYITESAADTVRHYVGGDIVMHITENGDDGNQVYFSDASVGFLQKEPTYNSGNTVVDFRHSNKQNLTFGAGNITHLQLYFPNMSGNFQLLIKQDGTGSRTITGAYKVYEYDDSVATGGGGIVVFAGGSNPTLTTDANHVDIISIYWDDDNQTAYGVASLDFQF